MKNKLIAYIKEDCPGLHKIKRQMTEDEAEKLLSMYKYDDVIDILDNMDNMAGIEKKYQTVYKTARNWLKMRKERKPQESKSLFDE